MRPESHAIRHPRDASRIECDVCRASIPLLPAGRRSLACRRWAGDRPQTGRRGTSEKPRTQVLLPVPGRSSASWTPTAFGQNQKQFVTPGMRPGSNAMCAAPPYRFCPQGVGALLAGDGLGTSPKPVGAVHLKNRMLRFAAGSRQIVSKLDSYGLRPESKAIRHHRDPARIKSDSSPPGCGQNRMLFVPRLHTASARRA
jgi:hypothetical protein